jgi:hypothetical protein
MDDRFGAALRDVIAAGRRKGLSYLTPGTLRRLACVTSPGNALHPGTPGHYRSIAHHSKHERFDRHPFIVIPSGRTPTHDELFAIAMATTGHRASPAVSAPSGDLVDLLRSRLVYPRQFARTTQLLAPAGIVIPNRARADYQRFVSDVVMHHLRYPLKEPPGTRAMRVKLVFIDALPIAPEDPQLSDYPALVRLAGELDERIA